MQTEPIAVTATAQYEAEPYEYEEARELMRALDLAEPVAITLVRRGFRTVAAAEAFISAGQSHDFRGFDGIEAIAEQILAAAAAGKRITIHGDYDVDGMASTAILLTALRSRGADCDWLIPDRSADGYGLSDGTIARAAERGTALLITADCGIACPDEVAMATALGIATVVTDHHQPGDVLPECPIVHPAVSGYPFEGLCGAGVAHKLVEALDAADGMGAAAGGHLDLVALATIADMVPLLDENRTLTRAGIAELRRARRPGVRALLDAARVEPEHLDEGDIAFRIAPRLNAAGRLYRADAGVELLITEDPERAARIAAELDAANYERREVEREVSTAAEAARRELPDELRDAAALVLAGEGWHPGVVGIAASRVVERHGRPAILLSIGPDGKAKGSGRSIPGFDLLAALQECSGHLLRFGGHKAAAGLELESSSIEAFRRDFAAAAECLLPEGPPERIERIDAVVGAEALDIRAAEQLGDLGPFGQGNPEVRLLVPWASVGDVRPMGEGGRHARFNFSSGGGKASAVAFNASRSLAKAEAGPADLTVRLELNHWNGSVEPRAVLARAESGGEALPGSASCACAIAADAVWWREFEAELKREPGTQRAGDTSAESATVRTRISHDARSPVALIAELLSSGRRILVLGADARRRGVLALAAARPARFGASHAVVCGDCEPGSLASACASAATLVMTDWEALRRDPAAVSALDHVVIVDPAPDAAAAELLDSSGPGLIHDVSSGAGELPGLCLAERWQPRPALAEVYRGALAEDVSGEALGVLLVGTGSYRRSPLVAARCVRVLTELGLAALEGDAGTRTLRVLSSETTDLQRSGAWRAYTENYEEGLARLPESRTAN